MANFSNRANVLSTNGLSISFPAQEKVCFPVETISNIDLSLHSRTISAIIGESGCGKSILASAFLGLLPPNAVSTGRIHVMAHDVSSAIHNPRDAVWSQLRGRVIGYVAQSSATCLTPTRTVGSQLRETLHALSSSYSVKTLLERVQLDQSVQYAYPHELSGGMAGRVAIALAIAGNPPIIIADEPTANLDMHLCDAVLQLLRQCADDGASVMLITHDIASLVRTKVADDVTVMRNGSIVEEWDSEVVPRYPKHPYTRALFDALPQNGFGIFDVDAKRNQQDAPTRQRSS